MKRHSLRVHAHRAQAAFQVPDFELVLRASSRTKAEAKDRGALQVNCVASGRILQAGPFAFELVIAWDLTANAEIASHSMLGLAVRRVDASAVNIAVGVRFQLVNEDDTLSIPEHGWRGCETLNVGEAIGYYPEPFAERPGCDDGLVRLQEVLKPGTGWLPKGTLTVMCKIRVVGKIEAAQQRLSEHNEALQDLSAQLGAFLTEDRHADVTIRVGEEAIRAHSQILAARSPVFEAMLSHPMKEQIERTIIISDVEVAVVRRMLGFIYAGSIKKLGNDADTVSLLKLAHAYQVAVLVRLCATALSSGLTESLAVERLMLADLVGIEELRSRCLDFITSCTDTIAAVQSTEAFAQLTLQRPHLVAEILAAIFPPVKVARTQ